MISIELKGVDDLLKRFDPIKVTAAARAALERTKTQARTQAVREIQKHWNIKKQDLEKKASGKPRIELSGRVNSDLSATITFWGGGISLAYFGAKEYRIKGGQTRVTDRVKSTVKKTTRRDIVGVKVQIEKGKTTTLRQWMAAVKYGKGDRVGYHLGVFKPAPGGGRYKTGNRKMIESQSISIISMVSDPKVMQPLKAGIIDTFNKRLEHELKYRGVTE